MVGARGWGLGVGGGSSSAVGWSGRRVVGEVVARCRLSVFSREPAGASSLRVSTSPRLRVGTPSSSAAFAPSRLCVVLPALRRCSARRLLPQPRWSGSWVMSRCSREGAAAVSVGGAGSKGGAAADWRSACSACSRRRARSLCWAAHSSAETGKSSASRGMSGVDKAAFAFARQELPGQGRGRTERQLRVSRASLFTLSSAHGN